ncbi:hypothetical protein [Sphaerisporangium aureirubrum]|uniref:Uncharacterized protein n=1 Tax=Sphaerisporangium aureirubrum TaxID=1544736 RepID=A0ABW1NKH8_9ACTN
MAEPGTTSDPAPVPPAPSTPPVRGVVLTPGVLVTAAVAAFSLAMVVLLVAGVGSSFWRIVTLLAASAGVAVVVVRLPASWRARGGLLVTAFVATAGLLPVLAGAEPEPKPSARVNVSYLADLVRRGPFTEELPRPLTMDGFKDVLVSDALDKVDAVALKLSWPDEKDPFQGFEGPNAHIEIYDTPQRAAERARQRFAALRKQYADSGPAQQNAASYFVFTDTELFAGGSRGHAYVEAYSFGPSNADLALASGTVTAVLRYTDRMAAQATG